MRGSSATVEKVGLYLLWLNYAVLSHRSINSIISYRNYVDFK